MSAHRTREQKENDDYNEYRKDYKAATPPPSRRDLYAARRRTHVVLTASASA